MTRVFVFVAFVLASQAALAIPNFICLYRQEAESTIATPVYAASVSDEGKSFLGEVGMGLSFGDVAVCSSPFVGDGSEVMTLAQALYKIDPDAQKEWDLDKCEVLPNLGTILYQNGKLAQGHYMSVELPVFQAKMMIYHYAPTAAELALLENSNDEEFANHVTKKCLNLVPGSVPMTTAQRVKFLRGKFKTSGELFR